MAEAKQDHQVTTRVCVKNVPLSFSDQKLSQHLCSSILGNLVVTDCRILKTKDGKSRKLAFVGFKTPEMASAVISRLHNTYAQTSKLSIEAAFSKNDKDGQEQHRPWSKHSVGSSRFEKLKKQNKKEVSKDGTTETVPMCKKSKKQEEESEESKHVRKRKQEFLAAMGVADDNTSNRKFWSNDDGLAGEKEQEGPPVSNDDNLGDSSDSSNSVSDNTDADSVDSGGEGADVMRSEAKKEPAGSVMTDFDFLQSKTTAVDNLTDDDDESDCDNEKDEKHVVNQEHISARQHRDDSSSSGSSSSSAVSSCSDDSSVDESDDEQLKGDKVRNATKDETPKDDDSHGDIGDSGNVAPNRLFVRNLPFTTTEEELKEHFSTFGSVLECHIPIDDQKRNKGFAFVTFDSGDSANSARTNLDGSDFQGRLVHILPARRGPEAEDDADNPNLTYKQKMELQRKKDANSTTGANTSFVRGDAVVDNLSERLGLEKGDILNVKDGLSSGDAAVRLALGETHIIEENREYFRKHDIDMEALVSAKGGESSMKNKRSPTSILVKNLPFDTALEDLTKLFNGVGGDDPQRILLPPSKTIALVEYGHAVDARRAFKKLAYRRFKHVPLYLEWAPISCTTAADESRKQVDRTDNNNAQQLIIPEKMQINKEEDDVVTPATPSGSHTIYVKNLNFSTGETDLRDVFSKYCKNILAVKIPQKVAPIRKGDTSGASRSLSMGFGFVECDSEESMRRAIKSLQGNVVDGHALELKRSSKEIASQQAVTAPAAGSVKNTKLMVRNVPFQASRKEILKLFGSFGQLKKVRLPKKFDGSHRGFAFVEFLTSQEAQTAMNALSRTHLYGRHLVLEWASDRDDLDTLRDKAKRDIISSEKIQQNKKIRFE